MRVIAANHPLRSDVIDRLVQDGMTLAEILAETQPDPILRAHAHVFVGDVKVPRERWAHVRPKASSIVTVRVVAQGGGGGGKNPLRTILTIAVMVAAPYAGQVLAGAMGVTGTIGTALLTAGVAVAGNMLVNAIAPVRPPSMSSLSGDSRRDSPTLSIEGARNNARPFGVVPVVLGKHRHVPPLAAQSYTEIVGEDQYLRLLVVWGYGPLRVENLRIGETPISQFDDVQYQHREGRPGDAPITLFPNRVDQENLSILLKQVDSWSTRRSAPDADELSIDFLFPNGLVEFNDEGKRQKRSVSIQVEYRKVGTTTWEVPPYIEDIYHYTERKEIVGYEEYQALNFHKDSEMETRRRAVTTTVRELSWIEQNVIKFTHNRTSAIRHGFRWPVPRGQYEIRVRRTTSDTDDAQISDTLHWTAIRSFNKEDPLNFRYPLCVTALSIRATDQLNSVVDQLNAVVRSYVTDFDGTEVLSSNPALLYRHVLQGNANARRLSDDRVDLTALKAWRDYCAAEGFEFNMIRDFQSSVWDTLADIAAAGRASPAQKDGKWSVVVDQKQSIPVQKFTPRNSWGFQAEKAFPEPPHAFRVRFASREGDWRQDERIVYADGYNASNAEVFETLDAPGITDPAHIWKFARFHLAQSILRPERWTFNVDFEHIVARRGDLVMVAHDVLLVGIAQGRIKSVTYDVDGNATGFVADEALPMEAGKTYGVSIRTVDDAALSREIVTVAGEPNEVTFASAIPATAAPSAGDLFAFGLSGKEEVEGLLLAIEPQSDMVAQLTVIPYDDAIYNSDTGTIPGFDPGITPLPTVPQVVVSEVRSDESVLQLGAGSTLIPHIAVSVQNINYRGAHLEIQIRSTGTGEQFVNATIENRSGNDYLIGDVSQGQTYDLRLRWNDPNRAAPGPWTPVNAHRVVGQSNPPQGLQGLTIAAFGGSALLRWDQLPELDVRFGGSIRFRHSPILVTDNVTWASSTSIGEAAKGDSLFTQLPLKPGTYVARVYDRGGRPSSGIAKISTKQASVLAYAALDSVTESPTFPGAKDGVVVSDGYLIIKSKDLFDEIIDFDSVRFLDSIGGISSGGTYTFAGGFDFLGVKKVRLTSHIEAVSVNVYDQIDQKAELIDGWEDFDGTLQAQADARVQVRHTDDDPATATIWSAWNNLDSAEFEARGFQFRVVLKTLDPAYNIRISELSVKAEEVI